MITKKSKGGGLAINPNHIFADSTARDAYFALHPTELVKGTFISVGTDYEEYDGTTYQSKTSILQGNPGLAGSIQVGTVTTLPAGSSATVVNVGTTNSAIFDFGIPKGADGAGGGSATWGGITGTLSAQTDLNSALSGKQATLISGTNIKTINGTSVLGSGNIVISGGGGGGAVDSVNTKTGVVTLNQDEIPDGTTYKQYSATEKTKLSNITGTNTGDETTSTIKTKLGAGSTSTDGYITSTDWNTFNGKQANLVSGTNIKTINGASVLGSGDIVVSGGSSVTVYADLAAIKAVDTTAYTDVQTVQVATLGLYKFQPASTLTGDDVNVITPTAGSSAGRWLLQSKSLSTITANIISPLGGGIAGTEVVNINVEKENGEVLINKKTRPTKTRKIVWLGSSVLGGYAATSEAASYRGILQAALSAKTDITYTFVNKCVGGNTTALVLDRFINDVVKENPDIVVIGLSLNNEGLSALSNNSSAGILAKEYKRRLEIITGLCEQFGYDYFIMGEYGYNSVNVYGANVKTVLNHQLSKQYGDKYVDFLGTLTVDDTVAFKAGTFSNATHPNDTGYAFMGNQVNIDIFDHLKNKFKPFEHWKGTSKITTNANNYVFKWQIGYISATEYKHLPGCTVTFEHKKGEGDNSVTLCSANDANNIVAWSVQVDANGYYTIYNGTTLATTTTILADANKKRKIVVRVDPVLSLVKMYVDGVEVASFTPTKLPSLRQLYLGSSGILATTTALNHEFANVVVYRGCLTLYQIKQLTKNDYSQSGIEFAHTLNAKYDTTFTLFSQTGNAEFAQMGVTQSWDTVFDGENTFTDTEKQKLANINTLGSAVASAATITAPSTIFHVTGTTAISTIIVPYTGFTGKITIIPDGVFTFDTAGNIAETYTSTVNRAIDLVYDGTKWYRV
jgi:lysophospholipase L1-like esterase